MGSRGSGGLPLSTIHCQFSLQLLIKAAECVCSHIYNVCLCVGVPVCMIEKEKQCIK